MDEATKERIAGNEALFREVNERVQEDDRERVEASSPEARWDFLCECGADRCNEPVALTASEYEAVRSSPVRFAVLPGHEDLQLARVVERNERFVVVEKEPGEQDVALATDPRGG